ncbi:MAG: hypothetical protein ACT4SY_04145 [Hyphomicrobiales bacterium]
MKISTSVWTGVALLAMAQVAQAAPPKVSGKYAMMIFTQCQAGFTTTTDTYRLGTGATAPAVKSLTPAGSGELNISVGTITFPATAASSGTASFEAYIVSGASLRINSTGGFIAPHTEAAPGTFSLTDTLFTFDPSGVEPAMIWTFRAGNIVSGLARTIYMVRRENARCVNAITATKQ